MVTSEIVSDDMKYDYGDSVAISDGAPACYLPGQQGSVCGLRHVATDEHAKAADVSIGTVLWLVEFGDGSSIEVPEEYLTLLDK